MNGPLDNQLIVIEEPATFAEIAIGEDHLHEVDDGLAFLGGVLLIHGWNPEVELLPLSEDVVPEPGPEPEDGEPCCGSDDASDEDELPVFAAIVTVLGVQQRLKWLGWYHEQATGKLDPATTKALHAFQEATHLPQNGLPDGATRDALAARIGW